MRPVQFSRVAALASMTVILPKMVYGLSIADRLRVITATDAGLLLLISFWLPISCAAHLPQLMVPIYAITFAVAFLSFRSLYPTVKGLRRILIPALLTYILAAVGCIAYAIGTHAQLT